MCREGKIIRRKNTSFTSHVHGSLHKKMKTQRHGQACVLTDEVAWRDEIMEVTRMIQGSWRKIRVILTTSVFTDFSPSQFLSLVRKMFFPPRTGRGTFHMGILPPAWKEKEGQSALLASSVFQVPLAENNILLIKSNGFGLRSRSGMYWGGMLWPPTDAESLQPLLRPWQTEYPAQPTWQRCSHPNPRSLWICYLTEKDFADGMKWRVWRRGDDSRSYRWTRDPYERRHESQRSDHGSDGSNVLGRHRKGLRTKECGWFLEAAKGKKKSPLDLWKEMQSYTLT